MGEKGSIGALGAIWIGIGAIVGGGFFATFGLTIAGAEGGTPIAFLLGGLIALLTAYSYVRLTLRYPGPGGTVSFIRLAFGRGVLAATMNVLLILSYIAIMGVYAAALASYLAPYLPSGSQAVAMHVIASLAIITFGLVNFAGASVRQHLESALNVSKLSALDCSSSQASLLDKSSGVDSNPLAGHQSQRLSQAACSVFSLTKDLS